MDLGDERRPSAPSDQEDDDHDDDERAEADEHAGSLPPGRPAQPDVAGAEGWTWLWRGTVGLSRDGEEANDGEAGAHRRRRMGRRHGVPRLPHRPTDKG